MLLRSILPGLLVVGLVALLTGCGPGTPPPANPPADDHGHDHDHGHGHAEKGPRGGQLLELGGDEYHAELLHDDAQHTITVHLLDAKAVAAVPTAATEAVINVVVAGQPTQFKLAAAPQPGDPSGQTSCFTLKDQALCEALDDPATKARLNVTIGDTPYTAELAAHDHAHEPNP